MLTKKITYTDYNGVTRTEPFYFNLSKAELVEMEMNASEGLTALIQRIADEKDNRKLYAFFKDIVLRAYGVKSDDGKRFVKNQEVRDAFEQSPAFEVFIMEFLGDDSANVITSFLEGIFPQDLVSAAKEANGGTLTPKMPAN